MEKRRILLLSLFLLLVGCNNSPTTPSGSSDSFLDSLTESITDNVLESESDSEIVEGGALTITDKNCPQGTGNSYPARGEYTIGDHSFIFNDVMNGGGKLTTTDTYIQMKKETGYIQNVTPFVGAIIGVTIYVNEAEYAGDMTHELTITAGSSLGEYETTLEAETSRDETYLYCRDETACLYQYFSLDNISNYAAYIKEISFIW